MTAQASTPPGFRLLLALALSGAAFFSGACRPFRPSFRPAVDVREIEGYASLRLTRGEESSRAKFAFAILLPNRARMEVFDAFGRSVSIFLIRGDEAYLVLPSEKAYWRGERDQVIEKFLGFPVQPAEIAGLISGCWSDKATVEWAFVRDERGRIISGTRGDLSFRVQEFFSGSDLPRRWAFRHVGTEGVVGLLEAAFNRPAPDFSLDFLRPYASKTWPEIEKLLR